MYDIFFYRDKNGKEPVLDYILKLSKKEDKDSRIKLNKIQDYIQTLSIYGTKAGEPYIKHLMGDIWELRPIKDRILFFGYNGKGFILLSYFAKKTKKTPKKEIEKAIKLMNDYIERSENYE